MNNSYPLPTWKANPSGEITDIRICIAEPLPAKTKVGPKRKRMQKVLVPLKLSGVIDYGN